MKNDHTEEEKMDEVTKSRIEVELHQEKVDFINDAYEKGLRYWKRAALERVSTENEKRVSTKESDFVSQSKEAKVS